jgi:hypothetical protein
MLYYEIDGYAVLATSRNYNISVDLATDKNTAIVKIEKRNFNCVKR